MSDTEALKIFSRQYVSNEMVDILVATTNSVIQIKNAPQQDSTKLVSLRKFICRLIEHSNVQTPTLMTALVYLNRLRGVLPGNAVGMGTTRHRIFLASLIISAKTLNDSSPLNRHWTKYTDGLLTNKDVNLAERELISLLRWNLTVPEKELVVVLHPFLVRIKNDLRKKQEAENRQKSEYYRMSNFQSNNSLSSTKSSIFSSTSSLRSSPSSYHNLVESAPRTPLKEKSIPAMNYHGHGYSYKSASDILSLGPAPRLRAN
ncbi:hypothetical protein PUMCH_003169 [Australozyma saopauloensis]|uniref:Cyclin N-terminal domain-containing protein n=1 Tax=Australozyma saopauloensis TaxID=291208 RepID=A0AAX4HBY1_9ASCO|nr:hypothetical protein PUMCH_003169 [[Candida] saopauloensis]